VDLGWANYWINFSFLGPIIIGLEAQPEQLWFTIEQPQRPQNPQFKKKKKKNSFGMNKKKKTLHWE